MSARTPGPCSTCKGTGIVERQIGGDGYGDRCAALADVEMPCPDCRPVTRTNWETINALVAERDALTAQRDALAEVLRDVTDLAAATSLLGEKAQSVVKARAALAAVGSGDGE